MIEEDHDQLIDALAYLYLRQEENALRVIKALDPRRLALKGRVAENVVRKLTAPKQADLDLLKNGNEEQKKAAQNRINTSVVHRDGLLFQHLSWIVARQSIPKGYMTSPHVRQADKGFDSFIIEFDEAHERLERIILCEDKASTDPRDLITQSVWKEIRSILLGERDDEVLADLATLLKGVPGLAAQDAEDVVNAIFLDDVRQFRVSVATGEDRRRPDGFAYLLSGFADAAPGPLGTRMGGVLAFGDVRQGLHRLAGEVATKVQELAEVKELTDV